MMMDGTSIEMVSSRWTQYVLELGLNWEEISNLKNRKHSMMKAL